MSTQLESKILEEFLIPILNPLFRIQQSNDVIRDKEESKFIQKKKK